MTLIRSLTHPTFALLWSGQTISRLGDRLYTIALAWWVLQKTGSATTMGTVLIFSSIPNLLFLLLGGVTVDRFSRTRIMLISDLLRGILITLVTALAVTGTLEVWHIFLASTAFGLVAAFFQPAYTALVPELVPSDMLPSANSLTALSRQLTGIFGPALGAAIVAFGGPSGGFALDALSFFISAACLAPLLPVSTAHLGNTQRASIRVAVQEGFSTVTHTPWLWITICISGLTNMTQAGPWSVALPFLVKDSLHAEVGVLGFLYSAYALGSALGAVWVGRSTRLRRRGLVAYGGLIGWGLATAIVGLPLPMIGLLVAAFLVGGSLAIFNLIWDNTLQELVPRHLLGRVASIDALGSFVLLPIGFGLAGWATDWVGAPMVLISGGLLTTVLVSLGLLHPKIRALD
ncbi:MAG: MFS transporter [Chloroflexi bacterium]|nr:MFS transporter [Chloroflexota bacterium]